ncbi:MAG: transglycosylase domain-containing protein [Thermotogae bacterium]|nr:transglycosylase domain-containing protein [Thermotogota bacterium]
MEENNVFTREEISWIEEFSEKYCISNTLIKLVILIEDKRFLRHKGIDYIAVARAILVNIKYLSIKQGASTISQQLFAMENNGLQLQNGRVLDKIRKILGALEIEKTFSKEEILCRYLNKVYLGKSYFGVQTASNGYFACNPCDLNVAQSFFLAERIALPNKLKMERLRALLERSEIRKMLTESDFYNLQKIYKRFFGVSLSQLRGRGKYGYRLLQD